MNYEFNLLHHVGVVAKRVDGGGDAAAAHEGDDNTPSGPSGRGVKTRLVSIGFIIIFSAFRVKGLTPAAFLDHLEYSE